MTGVPGVFHSITYRAIRAASMKIRAAFAFIRLLFFSLYLSLSLLFSLDSQRPFDNSLVNDEKAITPLAKMG